MEYLSKSRVRKAGSIIRKHARGECDQNEYEAAIQTINQYRSEFTSGLNSLSNSLRSFTETLNTTGEVSQRLKRTATIVEKLQRENKLDLSRMRDIGGCRLVIKDTIPKLYGLSEHILNTWSKYDPKLIDYIKHPRSSGYWALHIELKRDSHLYEVQLRTITMHSWAETCEAFTDLFKKNYKSDGKSDIHDYLRSQAQLSRFGELGEEPPEKLIEEFNTRSEYINELLFG